MLAPRLLILTLASALLAGCSGGGADDDLPDDEPSATQTPSGTGATTSKPKPDRELFNATLDFAAPTGGSSGRADVVIPAGYGNVTIAFHILADCPSGYAAESPRLVATDAAGTETVLWEYSMVAPNEPYACSPASGLMGRDRAQSSATSVAVPGTLAVATSGQFTGEARVVIVATA